MNILKCFLSFVLLLLYVDLNSATDLDDYKMQNEEMLKDLVKYEAKIEQLESTIKNQQANPGACKTTDEQEKLQAKIREQETTITTLMAKLAKDKSIADPAASTSCLPFSNSSDIQTIRLPGAETFQVTCDSTFAGEGWTVIQRRVDASVDFNRNWEEYKNGFGDLRGNFWLGLEKLHLMTKFQPHALYIQLEDFKNEKRYVRYTNFSVGNEAQYYELFSVGEYDGNAGDALSYLKNTKFTTKDRDNDKGNGNCGEEFASGWWFHACYKCNPNGVYVHTKTDEDNSKSITWNLWHMKPLKFVQMMIRPTNN